MSCAYAYFRTAGSCIKSIGTLALSWRSIARKSPDKPARILSGRRQQRSNLGVSISGGVSPSADVAVFSARCITDMVPPSRDVHNVRVGSSSEMTTPTRQVWGRLRKQKDQRARFYRIKDDPADAFA